MNETPRGVFPEPNINIIKSVCAASKDLSFKKRKFAVYLKEYQNKGIYCHVGKVLTPKRKLFYDSVRQKKLNHYIKHNKKKIQAEKLRLKQEVDERNSGG